ncbi:MAG: CTP synthase [Candidatus Bipolaricaulota bacterium]
MQKFIFVTGGVISGLGKGVVAASIGRLLKSQGYRVSLQKIDPYVNVDAGTMNPYEHGEVFVTHDGKETDLDIGRYERFLGERLSASHYMTTGQVYWNVIRKERVGDYLGKTVQVIPHITDEIQRLIRLPLEESGAEIGVVEIGGTVGDIESQPFLEAVRQMKDGLPAEDTFFVHLTLLPHLSTSDELKTKPTQHSVKELRAIGIQPDAIVARTERPLPPSVKAKIALFCDVPQDHVIEDPDLPSSYHAPARLHENGLTRCIERGLGLSHREVDLGPWLERLQRLENPKHRVRVGIVGKYVELRDAYISICESLVHAGASEEVDVQLVWISAEDVARDGAARWLEGIDGLLVPGGFGDRGMEGKIQAVHYARTRHVPYFGLCVGLQCAVIEFARNVLGLAGANSQEFDAATPHPVIALLEDQEGVVRKGATMRLGAYPAQIAPGTISAASYGAETVEERHRHRYELHPGYRDAFDRAGLCVAATSPDGHLVEIIEIRDHPWFVGVQFHPEFSSQFLSPHPLFASFLRSCHDHTLRSPRSSS